MNIKHCFPPPLNDRKISVSSESDMTKQAYSTAEGFGKKTQPMNNFVQKDENKGNKENTEAVVIPRPLMEDNE
jgi:hypothetical protein